ncbi:MAG TPA: hypothetical protein GX735_01020, partial [Firmicutes bacterium]|nr:hypothetical protein [Bacillota bacterium]
MKLRKMSSRLLVLLLAVAMVFSATPITEVLAQQAFVPPVAYVVKSNGVHYVVDYDQLIDSYIYYRVNQNSSQAKLAKFYFASKSTSGGGVIAYLSKVTEQHVDYDIFITKYVMELGRNVVAIYKWFNSGNADPGRVALQFVKVIDPDLKVIEEYQVNNKGYRMKLSTDASVKSVTVKGVTATKSGNTFSVTLPSGTILSDLKASDVKVTPNHGKAKVSTPSTSDGGKTWTFTVTAEDGKTKQTYTVKVSVAVPPVVDREIVSVETLGDITVPFGTALADTGLPAKVKVTLDDGSTENLTVSWDGGTPPYDGDTAGDYEFEGTFTLPDGIVNPGGKKAHVKVIVQDEAAEPVQYASTAAENFDIEVDYGTSETDAKALLETNVGVTGSGGETGTATIEWTI